MLPVIKIVGISNTTNSIKVRVKTSRNEGGKLEYYIKAEDEKNYTLKETKTDDSEYTFENLIQGKKYSVKVVAKAENGQSAEAIAEQTTGTVIDLKEGDLEFTSEPSTWTNTNVKVTVKANIDTKGYQLLTSQNPDNGWSKATSQTFTSNGIIYAILSDGVNYGASASRTIENIDKKKPIVTNVTTTSSTISIEAKDEDSGIVGYAVTTSNTEPKEFTSVANTKSFSTTLSGYAQGTTYYVWVKDEAGNISDVKSTATGKVADLTTANVKFTYSPSRWTNGDVTATASTTVSGFTLQTSKDGSNWSSTASQTYSSNGNIYARLWDGTNYGATATGNFTNIDKTAPTVSTALKSTSTSINSVALSVGITDTNSGLGKVEWYYGTTNNPTTKAGTTSVTAMNTSATGPRTAQTKTYTVTGLSSGTTYYFKAIVYDVAGNQVSSTVVPKHQIGDEVTFGGEPFYVIADKGTTYELLAKYVLNSAATKQKNAGTYCVFSTSNYWSGETLPTSSPYLNLNTYLAVRNDTGSAVYKANNYAKSLGAIGGRLLTYEEANSLKDSYRDIIFVTYGKSKSYWLGSAGNANVVWFVNGNIGDLRDSYFSNSNGFGVRPVIEISKSAI